MTLTATAAASPIGNCESIRTAIEHKIRASGVSRFSLVVVPASATADGRSVGSCERGTMKIVYQSTAAGPQPAAATGRSKATPPLLTECRDGRVQLGGTCTR